MYGYPVRKLQAGPSRSARALRVVSFPGSRSAARPVTVESKLSPPGRREDWIERPGLIRRLAWSRGRVVLLEAPAGYGKSTLAAQWQASMSGRRPFAWLSLDAGDNDPRRLWPQIVLAVQRACPELQAEQILQALGGHHPDIAGAVLPGLINELAALTRPVTLVLDGYQVIRNPRCHEQIGALLLHLPASVQIALLSRHAPPLALARLRAAGEMTELRARDLQFTPAETAALFTALSGPGTSQPDLSLLAERTEGWPAAVYLAGLARPGQPAPGLAVHQLTGTTRFIADYLAQEVLDGQPSQIRRFLTRTSVLDRFCAPLCDALLGSADSAEVLATLERENLFIIPLDESRRWFRYHPLFAEALRAELLRTEPAAVTALHERADAWLRQSGTGDEAITHAIAWGDVTGAVRLIAEHWHGYAACGLTATVRGWLRDLGDAAIEAHPLAAHCAAWAAALSGDQESVRRWLPVFSAVQGPEPLPDGIRSLRSSAALLRGIYGYDGLRVMREAAVEAAELEHDRTSHWYPLGQIALGYSRYLSGDAEGAEAPLRAAAASGADVPIVQMVSLSMLALALVEQGKVPQAEQVASVAHSLAARPDVRPNPQSSLAHAAAGAAHAAAGRLARARVELESALQARLAVPGMSPWPTVEALLLLTQVVLDLGDRAAAAAHLERARLLLAWSLDGAEVQLAWLNRLERRLERRARASSVACPLTERELVVLRLLRGSLPLREIAGELDVSSNTVKTHARVIYQKLAVSTRQDAVTRGHELGIL